MKILIVASANNPRREVAPFVQEQADSIRALGHETEFFPIIGKGWRSYLKHIGSLYKQVAANKYDIVHAHFIWSALVAVLQRKVPVVATFHGCDLNRQDFRQISRHIVYPLSAHCIVVNQQMTNYLPSQRTSWIPCGVNLKLFVPQSKTEARITLDMDPKAECILFCSIFDRIEKNSSLAFEAVGRLPHKVNLMEFKGYNRTQSAILYSAVDMLLMTSIREGSPQVIKEAMAANCPIVTTDVGDVRWVIDSTENCHICSPDAREFGDKIKSILENKVRTNGRERIVQLGLSLEETANKIESVYKQVSS
jgi:teichuronic acid biosynthesis glycosyltransferase TuaC